MTVPEFVLTMLERFRLQWQGRPLLLCLAAAAAVLVLWPRSHATTVSAHRIVRLVVSAFSVLALIAYVMVAAWYATSPRYYDYAEPTVTAVAWIYHLGQPLYHPVDSAARYAHMWGPMSFIVHGWALGLFGPSLIVSKMVGGVAAIVSLMLTFVAVRSVATLSRALVLTGFLAALLLIFRNLTFWTRPDPLQMFCVAGSLVLAIYGRRLWVAVLIGLLSGLLWNLKFTGPLYSLPVFAIMFYRAGWRSVAMASIVGALSAAAPFALLPNVSWTNYQAWVQLSASNGLGLATLRQNLEFAIYFGWPLLLSYFAVPADRRPRDPEWITVMIVLAVSVSATVVAAAKPGAFEYHLVPFLPIVMYLTAYQLVPLGPGQGLEPGVAALTMATIFTALAIGSARQAEFLTKMHKWAIAEGDDIGDLQRFAASHPGIIQMGYASSPREYETFARPLLVFHSGVYLLDSPAVQEHQLAGVGIPPATIDAIRSCRADYWLLPRDDDAWTQRNRYPVIKVAPLYPDAFRQAFAEAYQRTGTTDRFDVWQCRSRVRR